MIQSVQYAAVAVLAYLVAARWAYRMLRRRCHDRALWIFTACLVAGANAFLLRIPVVYTGFDRVLGVPNLAELIIFVNFLACASLVMVWTVMWAENRRRHTPRWILQSFAAIGGVLTGLFLLGRHPAERPVDFETVYIHNPGDAAFVLVFVLAFVGHWPVAALRCRVARRTLEQADQRWAAYGMRLVTGGMWLATLYALAQVTIPLAAFVGALSAEHASLVIGNVFASLSPFASISGVTCGGWGPYVQRQLAADRARREREALDALRRLLQPHTGMAAVFERLGPTLAAAQIADEVWQINDGYRNISPFLDAHVADQARRRARIHGYRGERLEAVVEAAVLRAALKSVRTLTPAAQRHTIPSFPDDGKLATQWQVQVARALDLVDADGHIAARRLAEYVGALAREAVALVEAGVLGVAMASPTAGVVARRSLLGTWEP